MKTRWLFSLSAVIVFAVFAQLPATAQEEDERPVTLEEVPPAVKATVLELAGDHPILEIEEVRIRQGIYYEAEWLVDDMEIEILVAGDGGLLCRSVEEPDREDEDEDEEDDDD